MTPRFLEGREIEKWLGSPDSSVNSSSSSSTQSSPSRPYLENSWPEEDLLFWRTREPMSGHFTNEYVRVSLPESGPSCIMPPATSTAIFHTFTEGQAGQACKPASFKASPGMTRFSSHISSSLKLVSQQ